MVRPRLRIRFRKQGDLRLIGHRDLIRAWERLFRRAAVSLRQTAGYHPRPRLSFPSALALGLAGADEVLEVELEGELAPAELAAALAPYLPPGLAINRVEPLASGTKPGQVARVAYEMPVPADRHGALAQRIRQLLDGSDRPAPEGENLPAPGWRGQLEELRLDEGTLRIQVRMSAQASVRPRDLLAELELADLEQQGLYLTRTLVELEA